MTKASEFRTHHTGVLVKDIAAAAASYTDALGYVVKTRAIHDPIQSAYVQFLALPGEDTYLELIAPDSPESHLNAALKKGGGVHHVCYSVSNIETAAVRLQEQGYFLIRNAQPAVAFNGRAISWLMNRDHLLIELVEKGAEGEL